VVQDKVHDDAEPETVGLLEEVVKILECAKPGVNIDVIAHVIAEVMHGRWIDGREPNRIHSERVLCSSEVLQPGSDAAEVADAVVIGVLKTPGVDLIEDGRLPPGRV
jgi:translation initiation factor 2 gamma subunit (eIF-2gamma)